MPQDDLPFFHIKKCMGLVWVLSTSAVEWKPVAIPPSFCQDSTLLHHHDGISQNTHMGAINRGVLGWGSGEEQTALRLWGGAGIDCVEMWGLLWASCKRRFPGQLSSTYHASNRNQTPTVPSVCEGYHHVCPSKKTHTKYILISALKWNTHIWSIWFNSTNTRA